MFWWDEIFSLSVLTNSKKKFLKALERNTAQKNFSDVLTFNVLFKVEGF